MWSWCTDGQNAFPDMETDSTRYIDKRTCVATINLEKNKKYVIWFNTKKYNNFKDEYRKPAVPYRLEFHTGSGSK